MKVRIRSGNQAGAVVEMTQPEAEAAVATGYAEVYVEPVEVVEEKTEPEATEPRRRR